MNVDEMELARQALQVTPWEPQAYERARAVLRYAMAESGPRPEAVPLPGLEAVPARGTELARARGRRLRSLGTRGRLGIGAGVAAVAAAAVAIAVTAAPQPAVPAGRAPQAHSASSALVSLASLIKSGGSAQPGNASLVVEKQVNGGKLMQVLYSLYTDDGQLYTGNDKRTLMSAVARQANEADSTNARELAAARSAATGNLATARVQMVNALPNCFGLGLSPAAQKQFQAKCWAAGAAKRREIEREKGIKTPIKMPTGQALQDEISNYLWTASTIALSWGGGDPAIREGVMRLLSTIPQVSVAHSTTAGEPTLTITAGPAVFGGGSREVLTVDARTGLPVSDVTSGRDLATAVGTSHTSRVTLAAIKAGKF